MIYYELPQPTIFPFFPFIVYFAPLVYRRYNFDTSKLIAL